MVDPGKSRVLRRVSVQYILSTGACLRQASPLSAAGQSARRARDLRVWLGCERSLLGRRIDSRSLPFSPFPSRISIGPHEPPTELDQGQSSLLSAESQSLDGLQSAVEPPHLVSL